MNISYDYYRIFYYVARYKSFTAAAKALMNNQPNVTRMIKKLESELGCTLFFRQRHGVKLTSEGKKLFEHIRIAFEHIEAGEEELALDKTLQRGTVSIGTTDIALYCMLLPILKEYRRLYPGIRICISSQSTPQAIDALEKGLVDIAVVTTPVDMPKTLKNIPIKDFQDIAVCGSAFSYLNDKILSLAEIFEFPLICLGEHTKTYEFYSDLFSKQGVAFSPSVEATAADQILSLVKNNLGIGFVPKKFLDNVKNDEIIYTLKLRESIPSRNICFVKRNDFSLSVAARKMEEMIMEARHQSI